MRHPQNLFLVGPMGAGKSAVGRQLARLLHLDFIDSDEEIESRTGVDIPFIFEKEGEGGFRKREARVIDEICEIFRELGFSKVRGPEAETEWYNFQALNIPLEHPAADMWDTFYVADGVVLRSHTSPVQARIMETHEPPVRVLVPGLCYRRDPFDPTHAPAFEQIEGLAVDDGIDFVELVNDNHTDDSFRGPGGRLDHDRGAHGKTHEHHLLEAEVFDDCGYVPPERCNREHFPILAGPPETREIRAYHLVLF